VASYRAALGPDAPFFERLLRTPRAFFSAEPERALATAVLAGFVARASTWAGRSRDDDAETQRSPSLDDEPVRAVQHDALVRGSICIAVLVFFLLLGDLLGGAPTHHEARSLLAAWFWCAILLAHFAERIRTFGVRLRVLAVFAISVTNLIGSALIRPPIPHEGFASREAEIDLGTCNRSVEIIQMTGVN
jgi:hypothetical protein